MSRIRTGCGNNASSLNSSSADLASNWLMVPPGRHCERQFYCENRGNGKKPSLRPHGGASPWELLFGKSNGGQELVSIDARRDAPVVVVRFDADDFRKA